MTVYSTQLAAGEYSSTGLHTLFTAAADVTTVVRDISVSNTSGASAAYSIYVATGSGSQLGYVLLELALANDAVEHWEGRQVMQSGQELVISLGGAPFYVLVSGYELD